MTINNFQKTVDDWIKNSDKGYFSELTNLGILMEEVGEMSRCLVREYGDQRTKESDKNVNLADEMADVLWVLSALANQCNIDLEEAVKKNLDKKNKRDI
ncbi:MAG: nucleotide pyrophosphohydrolase [Chitinophagaceae bacterium]|nr:nucleotide pyrophosphohydrolase [Chitinophagaceae bacterium]